MAQSDAPSGRRLGSAQRLSAARSRPEPLITEAASSEVGDSESPADAALPAEFARRRLFFLKARKAGQKMPTTLFAIKGPTKGRAFTAADAKHESVFGLGEWLGGCCCQERSGHAKKERVLLEAEQAVSAPLCGVGICFRSDASGALVVSSLVPDGKIIPGSSFIKHIGTLFY
jgi:hypothetical protein